ncbi:MAG: cytochrome C biogenesis protein [Chloroflexi bacterium]|nr:cytochrome C biogenesis protein [Chloroflexota bacterium]
MNDFTDVKLEIFIPQGYVDQVREALAKVGVGMIGNYDHCFAVSEVQGSFRPLEGAKPFDGKVGEITYSVEYKLEVNCRRGSVEEAVAAVRRSHPYEEPLINIIPLANHLFDMRKK